MKVKHRKTKAKTHTCPSLTDSEVRTRSYGSRARSASYEKKSSDKQDLKTEPAVDAGNEQLPVCKHGAECTQTDLIHFAEFWHPTAKGDGEENNNEKGESCEENECEVVELPYFDVESTQPVFDEYCDSESEDGDVTVKTHEDRLSSDSLGSQ